MAFEKFPPTNASEAVAVFKQDVIIVHDVAHGDENAEVLTENGLIPSIAKFIKDTNERIGDGGILSSSVPSVVLNIALTSGIYRYGSSDPQSPNAELGETLLSGVIVVLPTTSAAVLQVAYSNSTNAGLRRIYIRYGTTDSWSTWNKQLAVGDYGLGTEFLAAAATRPPSNDANLITVTGFYGTDSVTLGLPALAGGASTLRCGLLALATGSDDFQFIFTSRNTDQVFYGRKVAAGAITWNELIHTGNESTALAKDYAISVAADATLEINKKYYIAGGTTYTLPSGTGLPNGTAISVRRRISVVPTIQTTGGQTIRIGTGDITYQTDTSITFDINAELIFVWTGSVWEI
ncbi:tail fiber [Rheinheimera phage vB_RspM_Barba9A]|uniref:Tail fiber n=1 Tax=Rheinheimera phage vB_RspM_Barba9A TaxID=2565697 RepID=A0A4P8N092_9CAUD|nr:tail fiber [Rheinheimera phage vB_RspM_Barba9A]